MCPTPPAGTSGTILLTAFCDKAGLATQFQLVAKPVAPVNEHMFAFLQKRKVASDHPTFTGLPVQRIALSNPRISAAVHVDGRLGDGRTPLVCLAGYHRNMSDFTSFVQYFKRLGLDDWPVVLIDLPGRGRSDDRLRTEDYNSINDAADVADILSALGIGRAMLLGQGHGGQVAMLLAASHPLLIAGTILLDSGPVADSRGIVRLRNNMAHIEGLRSAKAVKAGFRRMLAGDYPGSSEEALDGLALRSHWFDKRGRARPLFDPRLLDPLKRFNFDDVLVAQWPLFDALKCAPLMMLRTQLTDQLRRETFEEMTRRRPEAVALIISGQGSPALFDQIEEVQAVAQFVIDPERAQADAAA